MLDDLIHQCCVVGFELAGVGEVGAKLVADLVEHCVSCGVSMRHERDELQCFAALTGWEESVIDIDSSLAGLCRYAVWD
jgi:hypothetical protein